MHDTLLRFSVRVTAQMTLPTCLVDLYNTAVCYLLNEAEKARLIVTYAWIFVLFSDTIYSYGSAR